jgi:hypothetical protein
MPGWFLRGFLLRRNLLLHQRLLMRHLVVVSPLVAPPSHLPWLVVASPLVAPPPPLNVPTAASQRTVASPCASALTSCSPLVKNTPPIPGRLFFWMPGASRLVDKDGINAWFLVGWCAVSEPPPPLPPPEIESRTLFMPARKINFGTRNLCITNTYHLYVFVIHKRKINFGIAPMYQIQSQYIADSRKSMIDGHKHNSTIVSDASPGTAAPKMNKSFIHMAHVSSDRACT